MARVEAGLSSGIPVAWAVAPRDAGLPRVVIWEIGGSVEVAVDGVTGMRISQVQVDCWGRSYKEAQETSDLVFAQLAGWSSRPAKIHAVLPTSLPRDFDPASNDTTELVFRRSLDFEVVHWT